MSFTTGFNKKKDFGKTSKEDVVQQIPLDQIEVDPNQPRKNFDEEKLEELSKSIKEAGRVQSPILVRSVGTSKEPKYIIVTGERRYRASKLAEVTHIRALLTNQRMNQEEISEAQLIENLQREDLTAFEKADAFLRLKNEGKKKTQRSIANSIGISEQDISNHLAIVNPKKIPEKWLKELRQHCFDAPLYRLLEIANTKNNVKRKQLCEELIAEYSEEDIEENEELEDIEEEEKEVEITIKSGTEYNNDEVWDAIKWISKKDKSKLIELVPKKTLDKILSIYDSKKF